MDRARPIVKLLQSGDLRTINPMDVLKQFGPLPVGVADGLLSSSADVRSLMAKHALGEYCWFRSPNVISSIG
jgi:hypothetical protein